MKTLSLKTKVAIIGLGNIGEAIAINLTKGDHPVVLAARDFEKAENLSNKLGNLASAKKIAEAIKDADVVIPAIYFDEIKNFLQTYSEELQGKIIIDVSNPIAPDGNGGFKKIIDQNDSAGKILSELIPSNSKIVKAFGTLGAGSLLSAAFSEPSKKVLFYASDNTNCNDKIDELIISSGFVPFHVGGIDQSIRIEVFGDLHEFGELGQPVTLEEAKIKAVKS